MKTRLSFVLLALLTTIIAPAWADEESDRAASLRKLVAGLHFQQGEITLENGLAKLNIPPSFAFLNAHDSKIVLSDIWGNPENPSVLGMIVPKGFDGHSWAVVISYDDSGYVKDQDAGSIDYAALLKGMQEETVANNKERVKQGYPPIELIGWAAPPHYDKATNKLYWAKELSFDGDSEHTLNYGIRVLGRRGVLVLNAVAGMSDLAEIEREMPQVISMVNFQEGHRYVDFDPGMDKVAGYGLAALVAGGVVAKTGFFKGVLVALLAAKKFVIVGVLAAAGFIGRLIKGRQQ